MSGSTGAQPRGAGVAGADFPHGCKPAQHALRFYSQRTHYWQAKRYGRPADRIKWPTCFTAVRAAEEWVDRSQSARASYERWWRYHYDWPSWLPDKWQRIGACETGYGRRPGSWTWDSGTYVSAFGIYESGYADDAHRIGQLSWDETLRQLHRYPTPREQYEAAKSHYAAHGGFSGWGCRGA